MGGHRKKRRSGAPELSAERRVALGIPDASGVALLGADTLVVVDDDDGLYLAAPGRAPRPLDTGGEGRLVDDLEGITIDLARERVVVVSEKGGRVCALSIDRRADPPLLGPPIDLGRLPAVGKLDNKGWEGIAWVEAGVLAPGEVLLAVHEAKPKRLGLFTYPDLTPRALLELPRAAKDALADLSDVAYDPARARVWILSDESRSLAAFALRDPDQPSLELEAVYRLPIGEGEKPEGVAVDGDRLWIVTDGESYLYRIAAPT